MYDHKTNQTRQQILESFVALVQEKDVSKITINDITTGAKINRGTFYRHFDDKLDLIEKTETIIFDQIKQSLQDNVLNCESGSPTPAEFTKYRADILKILQANAPFISAMLSKNGDLTFETKLMQHMRNISKVSLVNSGIDVEELTTSQELTLQFMANGLLGIIRHWLTHNEIPIETVADTMDTIMSNGIIAALNVTF
jgi:AcrR family transcriptional regulator